MVIGKCKFLHFWGSCMESCVKKRKIGVKMYTILLSDLFLMCAGIFLRLPQVCIFEEMLYFCKPELLAQLV